MAPLWGQHPEEILRDMASSGLDCILVRVANDGLQAEHLNRPFSEVMPTLLQLRRTYGIHVCGEGGEFESFVRDAPSFKSAIQIDAFEIVN
jgi:diphthine-ammonia ligase